jgi:amino acid transporter
MQKQGDPSLYRRLKTAVIGKARDPLDRSVFHRISLVAFFAWVGLGADGLSSSCYGPPEAFLELLHGGYGHLGLFVGLATALTVIIISASYSQIVEAFPSGGGGYLVASKLLTPRLGMVAGCALLIDYVLTISVSIASGTDAIFSFLPYGWHEYKLPFAACGVLGLMLLNLRGVRESVLALLPVFIVFVLTHIFAIVYPLIADAHNVGGMVTGTIKDARSAAGNLGTLGAILLVLRAYSMGAGTFTGIEAVSNGMSMLREPRVQTAKRTMLYMATSLAFTAGGLMVAYILTGAAPEQGKTVNASLFGRITAGWNANAALVFVLVTLLSEGAILFVAAQTGFLGGPQVISFMALDRWLPNRFAVLSDRLVIQNGILVMGVAALVVLLLTGGSVAYLLVLYSINVFITFCLSQAGMVRHWWSLRHQAARWGRKLLINGLGLALSAAILVAIAAVKFHEGGWITLVVTGSLVAMALAIRAHYDRTARQLRRLDDLLRAVELPAAKGAGGEPPSPPPYDPQAKTAVILVGGFNGMGLHTTFDVIRLFGECYKSFAFVQVGVIDVGSFKGLEAVQDLQQHVPRDLDRYVQLMRRNGFYAEAFWSVGVDTMEEVGRLLPEIRERFPNAAFFGGQLVFEQETIWTRWLHNYLAFALQRMFYREGVPFVILPIRVQNEPAST